MDICNKELPPTPGEHSQSKTRGLGTTVRLPPKGPCSNLQDGIKKDNEDLKKANKLLQHQVQQLALENNVLRDQHTKALEDVKHCLEIIEIQKTSSKNIMQYIIVSTSDCRTAVREKFTNWEQRETEDPVSSLEMPMF